MSSASSSGSALTRQSSHSHDLPSLSPSTAATSHRAFSFIRSASFSKARPVTTATTIPELEKEPIFDEIRDCDEAPYPQTNTKPLSPARRTRSESNTKKSLVGNQSNGSGSVAQPHKHKWLNKLDPRFDTKLLEEQRKKVEREEKERRKRKEEDLLEGLMPKWVD